MDWKDALAGLRNEVPEAAPEPEVEATKKNEIQKEPLHILIDRRQRKGKTATLIEGFLCDDSSVKEIAAMLKQKIGTGGSCRGGDILLQGDWRQKAADMLKAMGYKCKLN
ncbi:MAG: translation initiation factor [Prevotella sp.]|nr:translation initiation factor [Bacteroides sp.]MCM1366818.1 translation initiation factor [Prevotella sp.]MCM1437399.1 translation initiation factor [Prevotella sp.]